MQLIIGMLFWILIYEVQSYKTMCENSHSIGISCTVEKFDGDFDKLEVPPQYHNVSVISLVFKRSNISSLSSTLFKLFPNVTKLDLSNSGLQWIENYSFSLATKLNTLTLSSNNLSELADSQFIGANELVHLDLSYNQIRMVNENTFKYLTKLLKIDLSHNQISSLPGDILPKLKSDSLILNNNDLEALNLDNNQGRELHADNNELRSDSVKVGNNGNLIKLSLRNNKLTDLNFIRNMTNLHYLDVSYNPLSYDPNVDNDVFTNLKHLVTLKMKSVNLNRLHIEEMLPNLPVSLVELDISSNGLTTIDFNNMSHLNNLERFNINDNRLRNQTFIEFTYLFENLTEINICENEWECEPLMEALKTLKQLRIHVDIEPMVQNERHIRGIRCFDKKTLPNVTSDTPLAINKNGVKVQEDGQGSSQSQPKLIIAILIIVMLILATLVFIIYFLYFKRRYQTNGNQQGREMSEFL